MRTPEGRAHSLVGLLQVRVAAAGPGSRQIPGGHRRTVTAAGGAATAATEDIYEEEPPCEFVYRKRVYGSENQEPIMALRVHPPLLRGSST